MDPRALILHLEAPYSAYRPDSASARDVILAGLSWPADYWVGLALGWLEQGAPIDAEIAALLDRVARKSLTQSVRHRAFALARKWERGHSTRLQRHVNAPRADVYRALLDARAISTWMVPDGMTSQVHEFEAREGGRFRVSLTYDEPTG